MLIPFINRASLSKTNIIISGALSLGALLLIGVLINTYYLSPLQHIKTRFNNPYNQLIYDKWSMQIKRFGAQQAYMLFKTETEKKTIKTQHSDAHLFGEALYRAEGTNGISVCDNSFNYGCYHSFLGSAISEQGLNIIPKLSEECFENLGKDGVACQHGIGHGVLSSFGYDLDSLKKSLAVCDTLKDRDPVGGCPSGVFMEYNFQTMLPDAGMFRNIDEDDPYFPCFNIDKTYTGACIYQQAQWWQSSIRLPSKVRIKRIDLLCNGLDDNLKSQCYKGFGINLFAYANYNLDAAKKICHSLSSSEAEAICRSGIAILLSGIPDLKKESLKLCADPELSTDNQLLCSEHLDQIATSPIKNN